MNFKQLCEKAKEKQFKGKPLSQIERIAIQFEWASSSGQGIPCYFFPKNLGILQYNARIKTLRDKYKANIKSKVTMVDGQRHGVFWLKGGRA